MQDYGQLEKIVDTTIKATIETKKFDLGLFRQDMEKEFARLGFREPSSKEGSVQKILILRLDAVGDFILLTPSIRAIRENFPRAYITLVVTKAVYPMAELCPYVNEVIVFETPFKSSVDNKDVLQIFKTTVNFSAQYLWKKHFDICFSFLNDVTHSLLAYISGAKIRVGEGGGIANIFLNNPIPVDHIKISHWCEKNLYLVQACGLKINSADLEIWYDEEDLRIAKDILKDFAPNRLKIAFGLAANTGNRRYPVEKYLIALKKIVEKGASLILLGGPTEIKDAQFLEDNLPKEFVKNVAKIHLGWRVDSAIISLTDMYLGNDTGTQHIAATFKKPVIVLSRETKDRLRKFGAYCENVVFSPWQTKYITLLANYPQGIAHLQFLWVRLKVLMTRLFLQFSLKR